MTLRLSFGMLSSPKGLCAESARAVTSRQWGGEDFLTHHPSFFFTKAAITRGKKSKNRSHRGKRAVSPRAKNRPLTIIGIVWQKLDFWAKKRDLWPKKHSLPYSNHVLAMEKDVQRKKYPFPK